MFLLDTNVISELRHGKPQQAASVRAWAEDVPANQLYLSAITVLELEMGVLRVEREKIGRKAKSCAPGQDRCCKSSRPRFYRSRLKPPSSAPVCMYPIPEVSVTP